MTSKKGFYPGNKNIPGVIEKIINQIPECEYFYELFAGSAAVSKKVAVGSMAGIFVNDLDFVVLKGYDIDFKASINMSNKNALDIIISHRIRMAGKETFIFLDPPYMHDTRPLNKSIYKHEMTDFDHKQLLLAILKLNCNVMMIHPKNDLYEQLLNSWRSVQIKIRYHNKTSIENLYMNYPPPQKLLISNYTGSNCWDRQRIKRKGDRLIHKIKNLPVLEKEYLLDRIKNEL